jgi:hypothetical protein
LTAFIVSDMNYKMAIFLSQTERTPKHILEKKKSTGIPSTAAGARDG